MRFACLISSRYKAQTFKMPLNKGFNKFWTPWMLQYKINLTNSVKQKSDMKTRNFHIYIKKSTSSTSGVSGGEVPYLEIDIKTDSQRPCFEELHASGRVHTCLSEACAYVLTSKHVLKSLCELWAGSATAQACSEPVSAWWYPFCMRVILYCLKHAVLPRVCSPRGYKR